MAFEHDDQEFRRHEQDEHMRSMRFDLALESELNLDDLEDDWDMD